MSRWGNPSGGGPTRTSHASGDSFDALLVAAVSPPGPSEGDDPHASRFTRLTIGSTVSQRFVVEWFAGAGGMGAVYRCHDLEADAKVALKVIRKLDDQSRFRREAAILASLSHPAIVRYVAHGSTEEGTPYLAMEWLDGEDLGRRLCRGRIALGECLALLRGVCAGLVTAHAQGFVHRDIKPSNVYLVGGRFEAVKLLDFGIAHRGAAAQTMTRTGTVLGTVGYMAPEQAVGARAPDARADLFSLGCVLFECLTGQPAFPGEGSLSVLESVLQSSVPDVCSLRPEVPAALGQLVARLLDKDREARPHDAASVLRALEALAEAAPGAREVAVHAPFAAPPPRLAALPEAQRALRDEVAGSAAGEPIGRDKELSVLDAVLAATIDETTAQAVLVTAPSGLGKTRLARAFAERVSARGAIAVMVARADAQASGPDHALARSLCPGAFDQGGFAAWLGARGADGPLLICIDDAHAADLASTALLARALAGAADRPILLLGFARVELPEPLRAVWRSLSAQTLCLRPLTDRAAVRLLRSETPERTPTDAIDRVVTLAQGSPRLLRAFAQALAGRHGARALATTLLADQLAQLDPRERAVLAAAAALGPRVDAAGIDAVLEGAAFAQPTLLAMRERKLMLTERYDLHCAEFPLVEEMLRDASLQLLGEADRGLAVRRAERWLAHGGAQREPVTR